MNSTTIPLVRYRDAEAAVSWLCRAFGFEVFLKVGGEGGRIEHARLTLETNMIMLASIGRSGAFEDRFRLPAQAGGVTQSVIVTVQDPDARYASARAAGATIIDAIADFRLGGGRLFSCEDLESHVWVFASGDPWRKSW
jgi:uncharacterized glyoxalase superfamily protein PhnB